MFAHVAVLTFIALARKNHEEEFVADYFFLQKLKTEIAFKVSDTAVPPTFSGLSNQIAKEQNDR